MNHRITIPCIAALGLAAAATADITDAYVVSYSVTAEDFGGTSFTVNV